MNLRSITEHLKGKSHTNVLEKRKKAEEIHKGTDNTLQERVDNVILRKRTISPVVVWYIIYAVRDAANVNIAMILLEGLD